MRKLKLSQGKYAVVDDKDYRTLVLHKWHAIRSGKTWYAIRNSKGPRLSRACIRMHRAIVGVSARYLVDHEDGNGLNNRRRNLRVATRSQNNANRGAGCNNLSGLKGVTRNNNRWAAQIRSQGQQRYLGSYNTREEAATAYAFAAILYFGEFARI